MNKEDIKPRIVTGRFKGRKLIVPENAKPITERVKIMIFDLLGNDLIQSSNILDIFAGSGNLGFEALSRGAKSVTFVDESDDSINCIKKNATNIGVSLEEYKFIKKSYRDFNKKLPEEKFDLIFIDPPFSLASKLSIKFLGEVLSENGVIILKIPSELEEEFRINRGFKVIYSKKIGINYLYFLNK